MRPWTCLVVLPALLGPRPIHAQPAGMIVGTVTPPIGAIVSGATVTVTNESTRWTRSATTDARGSYAIVALPPGRYSWRVECVGSRPRGGRGLRLVSGQTLRLDATLSVGAMTETIEVEGGVAGGVPGGVVGGMVGGLAPSFAGAPLAFGVESYDRVDEGGFRDPREHPLSTFSIDVDTASYANLRRFLNQASAAAQGRDPLEELVNYFSYSYPEPSDAQPFSVTLPLPRSGSCSMVASFRFPVPKPSTDK